MNTQVLQDREATAPARSALNFPSSFHQQVVSIYPGTSLSEMIW